GPEESLRRDIEQREEALAVVEEDYTDSRRTVERTTEEVETLRGQIEQYAERQELFHNKLRDMDTALSEEKEAHAREHEAHHACRQAREAAEAALLARAEVLEETTDERHDFEAQLEEVQQERARLLDWQHALQEEIDTLKAENQELVHLERENRILKAETERVAALEREMEGVRAQNSRLRSDHEAVEGMRAEIEHLHAERADLTARLTVANAVLPEVDRTRSAPPSLPEISLDGIDGLGPTLEAILQALKDRPGVEDAIFTDLNGLLLAGEGGDGNELGLAASLAIDRLGHIQDLVPFGTMERLVILDRNNLFFTAQPIAIASGACVLATLTVGPGPTEEEIGRWAEALRDY
ncbi:MAG: hypothetical protein HQL50_15510, partial [Magnetococcales bacterium]|nr:hypothetical protein [Magnetococcales bacterium]